MRSAVDVRPASLDQVLRGQDGRLVEIDSDAGQVVADLQRLDPTFRVRVLADAEPPCFVVYQALEENGQRSEHFVLSVEGYWSLTGTLQGLDQRVVRRVGEIMHEDFGQRLQRAEDDRKREGDVRARELVDARADELMFALQKDTGAKPRIFVP